MYFASVQLQLLCCVLCVLHFVIRPCGLLMLRNKIVCYKHILVFVDQVLVRCYNFWKLT